MASCSIEQFTVQQSLILSASTAGEISLAALEIGYVTPLIIEITNQSATTITDLRIQFYDEKDVLKTMRLQSAGFSLPSGQTLLIDSSSGDITQDGLTGVQWLKSGDFPVVSVNGTREIKLISSTAATLGVVVKCNARWL